MIIPSKHSGYRAGIRLYPGGSGGDSAGSGSDFGGSSGGAPGSQSNPDVRAGGSMFGSGYGGLFGPVNTGGLSGYVDPSGARSGGFDGGGYGGDINNNNTVVKKTQPTAGTSTIDLNNPALKAIGGSPYNQSGQYYNSLLQQGYAGNDIRNALTTQGRPISDSNYEALVQNAGMVSPTGRPMAGSDQFTQPVYNSQYQNYTNPLTTFNVSNYGTNPGMSRSMQAATAPGAGGAGAYYQHLQGYGDLLGTQGNRNNINTLMNDMRQYGISAQDLQSAFSYTPPQSNYGGRYGGGDGYPDGNFRTQQYVDPSTGRSTGLGDPSQMQTPFSYQPMQQIQGPFSYQQQQYNPYQQQQYNPYQMQSPFSYQQPRYNPYDSYDSYPQTYQQPQPVVPTSSGPTSPIVGRSSQMRGTPNVMRRAEGGIAGILKK